jgi:DHA1 family purine ribonucleoside efflux pump-like MFS transporter
MRQDQQHLDNVAPVTSPQWTAIFAVAVSVACLITVELLPASLLTPMVDDLGVSSGVAGQTLTVTAFVAIFSGVFATGLTRGVDRRTVVMAYSALLVASSLLAALGPNFAVVLAGRVLLGLPLGGFWAMAASLTMRLAPPKDVPKALSVVFGGVSVALVIAAPAGSFLGALVGWRGVFLLTAALGAGCLVWEGDGLPRMPAGGSPRLGAAFGILGRPGVPAAMLAIFAVFAGQFAFFTYMRPFFETVPGFGVEGVSALLLLFGVTNFLGTSVSPWLLNKSLKLTLALAPLVVAACAGVLFVTGSSQAVTALVIAVWGLAFGTVPVGWSTWVTRCLADDAESAGGLQVATIQLANTVGAAVGGVALDTAGVTCPVAVSGLLLALTVVLVITGVTVRPTAPRPAARAPSPGIMDAEVLV